jgi:hypothetical protein
MQEFIENSVKVWLHKACQAIYGKKIPAQSAG